MTSPARREITGRKVAATAGTVTPDTAESETDDEATDGDKQEADADKPKRKKPTVTVVAEAFSIPQFCTAHGFSRAFYYILKQRGLGPNETRLLSRVIITKENAARWRKRRSRRERAPEAARAWRRQRADTSTRNLERKRGAETEPAAPRCSEGSISRSHTKGGTSNE